MTAELFTVASQPTPGLSRLQASVGKFGLPITILGQNQPQFWGFGWKWKSFVRAAKTSSADIVMFCDGYDSICLDSMTGALTKFESLAHPIVFSFLPPGQPEYWLGLDSGLVMAERNAMVALFEKLDLDEFMPDHFIDQDLLQNLYSWDSGAFMLDRDGLLFHTLGPRSPELIVKDNRLTNPVTGNSPSFVHGPSNQDLSKVEQWLAAQN